MSHIHPISQEYIPQNLKFKQNNTTYAQRSSNESSNQSNLGIIVKNMLQSVFKTKKYDTKEKIIKELESTFNKYKINESDVRDLKMRELLLLCHKLAKGLLKRYIKFHNISFISHDEKKEMRMKFGDTIYSTTKAFTNEYKDITQKLSYLNDITEDDLYIDD